MTRWLKWGEWFDYHRLSWRGKFLRTLWVGPVAIALFLGVGDPVLTFEGGVEEGRPLRWVYYALAGALGWLYAAQTIRADRRSRTTDPHAHATPLPGAGG